MKTAAPFVIFFAGIRCIAQSAAADSSALSPTFEVASVRLAATEGSVGPPIRTSPDSLNIHGVSLRDCIQMAYRIPPTQVTAPDWLNDVRLDIVAKAGATVEEQQLYLMLRMLLAERLGVKVHIEKKEMQVYTLMLAKAGAEALRIQDGGPTRWHGESGRMVVRAHVDERFRHRTFAGIRPPRCRCDWIERPLRHSYGLNAIHGCRSCRREQGWAT